MNLQVGVKILLKNKEDKYLILLRSKEKYPDISEQWDIPGGRIDIGISLFENLQREVTEETGLSIINEPKLLIAQDIIRTDKHVVRLTYIGYAEGDVVLSDEHSEYRWVSIEDLKLIENLDSYVKEILESVIYEK